MCNDKLDCACTPSDTEASFLTVNILSEQIAYTLIQGSEISRQIVYFYRNVPTHVKDITNIVRISANTYVSPSNLHVIF